jgi:hypothetical protein
MKKIISIFSLFGILAILAANANAGAGGVAATVSVSDGAITAIAVSAGGSGYNSAPTIFLLDSGGGTGAVATATVSGGAVTGVSVTDGGSGYTASSTRVVIVPNLSDIEPRPTAPPDTDPPTDEPDSSSLPDDPPPPPSSSSARIINISTRGYVGTGDNQELVGGFVLMGSAGETKTVLIKGVSSYMSSLPEFTSGGLLDDPKITVQDIFGKIVATNDSWKTAESIDSIDSNQQSQFATSYETSTIQSSSYDIYRNEFVDDNQAGMLISLPLMTIEQSVSITGSEAYAGYALYTVVVSSASGSSGVAQVAIEDLDRGEGYESTAKLVNISTRGFVGSGPNQELVGGFVLMGEPGSQKGIIAKGVAQYMSSLPEFSGGGLLDDPKITLQDIVGKKVAVNDNWQTFSSLDSNDDISTLTASYDPSVIASETYSAYRNELNNVSTASAMFISLDVMSAEQAATLAGNSAYAGYALYTAVVTSSSGSSGVAQVAIEDPDRN